MTVNSLPINQGIIHSYSSIICSYSSFINVANYYNENMCEELVYLKRKGLKIDTNMSVISSLKDIVISNKFEEIIYEFLDENNIANKDFLFDNSCEFLDYVHKQINNLNPVIIAINSSLINYSSINLQNSNRDHTLVICGFDKKTQKIYFYDYFIPSYPSKIFYGSMNVEDLKTIVNKNGKFEAWYFDYQKIKEIIGPYEKNEFMLDLKNNIDTYLDNLATIELIVDSIKNLPFLFSKEDIINNSQELTFQIMHRSIVPSRILFRNICKKYNWSIFYNDFDTLALEWYTIAFLLIKCSFTPSEEKYFKLSKRITAILEKEKNVMNSMRNYIKKY